MIFQQILDISEWIGVPGKKTLLPLELTGSRTSSLSETNVLYFVIEADFNTLFSPTHTHHCQVWWRLFLLLEILLFLSYWLFIDCSYYLHLLKHSGFYMYAKYFMEFQSHESTLIIADKI